MNKKQKAALVAAIRALLNLNNERSLRYVRTVGHSLEFLGVKKHKPLTDFLISNCSAKGNSLDKVDTLENPETLKEYGFSMPEQIFTVLQTALAFTDAIEAFIEEIGEHADTDNPYLFSKTKGVLLSAGRGLFLPLAAEYKEADRIAREANSSDKRANAISVAWPYLLRDLLERLDISKRVLANQNTYDPEIMERFCRENIAAPKAAVAQ